LSSAILYVAIVAIWAGVLIPRWLRRDSSERASDDASTAEDTPVAGEQPGPPAPRTRSRDEGRPGAAEARPGVWEVRPRVPGAPADDGRDEDARRSAGDQEHARVLSARRRLLVLLLVLTAGSCALAFTRLAAWWVMAPSAVMLLGYLALLREAAQADAERRQLTRSRAAQVAAGPLTPAAPPPPAPDAEIIDISASMDQAGEEFYDQYADAKLRAVGDLACAAHGQDLRAPERDVGVKGELLVRRQLQVRVAAGQFGHGDLRFELAEVRA
jgi:hypothetical protein